MFDTPLLVIGLVTVATLGVLGPRLLERIRLARALRENGDNERRVTDVDLSRIATYHGEWKKSDDVDSLDDATWSDLNLDALFLAVDRTASRVGRQVLYDILRRPQSARDVLERLEAAIQRLSQAPADGAQIRKILRPLDDARAGFLPELLSGVLPARPRFWWVFPLLTATACACLALVLVWPKAIIVWLAVCLVNIGVQLTYRPRVRRLLVAFQSVPALVGAAEALSRLRSTGIEQETACLLRDTPHLRSLRRATRWLLFESGSANELVSSLYEYVNLLFLLDINAFVFSIQRTQEVHSRLSRVYEAIGRLDAAQSIAQWRLSLPYWSIPQFSLPAKALQTTELFHPLLAQPVANTLSVRDASILITGSNMAGKTTFMRTLGVNAILAQTLHTVCARDWGAPLLHVRSSIGRADSLLDGKSHYLAEVESVHALLRAKEANRQHLFLVDELFRGTNTAERVAAAYGVLAFLTRGADLVVVATHDVELVTLLGDAYHAYHFRERIVDNTLSFDYQLRAGPSSTRNAIALLELKRYPVEIIADALAVLNR